MIAGRIVYDTDKGNPVAGRIWQFGVNRDSFRGKVRCEYVEHDSISHNDCTCDPDHVSLEEYVRIAVDLFGGPTLCDFVPVTNHGYLIISSRFKEKVERSGLTGWSIKSIVEIRCDQSFRSPHAPLNWMLHCLVCRGHSLRSDRLKVVQGRNLCPHCLSTPMICPGCGRTNWPFCEKCGRATLFNPLHPEYSATNGFVLENYPPQQEIVEGASWDGTDFFYSDGIPFISEKARKWMITEHVDPVEFNVALLSSA